MRKSFNKLKNRFSLERLLAKAAFCLLLYGLKTPFWGAWEKPETAVVSRDTQVERQKPNPSESPEPSSTKLVFEGMIRFFQLVISPQDGPACAYHPTCSRYGKESIAQYGVFLGTLMAVDRYLRCNPWNGPHGIDLPAANHPHNLKKPDTDEHHKQ